MGTGGLGSCGRPPLRRGAAPLRSHCIPEVARPLPPRHVCLWKVKGSLARFPVGPARVPLSACPRSAPDVFRASVSPYRVTAGAGRLSFLSRPPTGLPAKRAFLCLPYSVSLRLSGPTSSPTQTRRPISIQTRGTGHLHAPPFHLYVMPALLQTSSCHRRLPLLRSALSIPGQYSVFSSRSAFCTCPARALPIFPLLLTLGYAFLERFQVFASVIKT